MPNLNDFASKKLSKIKENGLLRTLHTTKRTDGVHLVRDGKTYISFTCNDYLGLSHHPKVKCAAIAAIKKYGAGAGASRLVTGSHPLYAMLESQLSRMKHTEAALVFGSGYLANIGTIPALISKGDLIIADKFIHACMVDAAQLSGATWLRFPHNNIEKCEKLLVTHRPKYKNCLILTETIFSMDGDHAPIEKLLALAEEHDAWLLSDDAHGLGVVSSSAFSHERHIQLGTLSKSIGAYGGYVCASQPVIDLLINTARSAIFTTGLPPATIASASAALNLLEESPEMMAIPLERARLFTQLVGLPEAESAIVPYIIGDNQQALSMAKALEAQGFLVSAIRPPTVPNGTARLRFTFSALHTETQVQHLAEAVNQLTQK